MLEWNLLVIIPPKLTERQAVGETVQESCCSCFIDRAGRSNTTHIQKCGQVLKEFVHMPVILIQCTVWSAG